MNIYVGNLSYGMGEDELRDAFGAFGDGRLVLYNPGGGFRPDLEPGLQWVTTEVVGNCSFSAFPIEPDRLALHADHLARATAPLTPWWTDFDGYADALAVDLELGHRLGAL